MQSNESENGATEAAKIQAVEQEIRDEANRDLPGGRAALPEGALTRPQTAPQADEHRDQPVSPGGTLTTPLPGPKTSE